MRCASAEFNFSNEIKREFYSLRVTCSSKYAANPDFCRVVSKFCTCRVRCQPRPAHEKHSGASLTKEILAP